MKIGSVADFLVLAGCCKRILSWSTKSSYERNQRQLSNRRAWIQAIVASTGLSPSLASADPNVDSIREASTTLQSLLNNWNKAVIDCTYADVPRELLESKNKEQLLEKASTFALFDKSVSVVSCKTSNKIVRNYLGKSGNGPLVGLDKKVRFALSSVEDPDDLDRFVQASEALQQALSRADSLSYASGVADFSSVNNFQPEDQDEVLASNNNLGETRMAIQEAVNKLNIILNLIDG